MRCLMLDHCTHNVCIRWLQVSIFYNWLPWLCCHHTTIGCSSAVCVQLSFTLCRCRTPIVATRVCTSWLPLSDGMTASFGWDLTVRRHPWHNCPRGVTTTVSRSQEWHSWWALHSFLTPVLRMLCSPSSGGLFYNLTSVASWRYFVIMRGWFVSFQTISMNFISRNYELINW